MTALKRFEKPNLIAGAMQFKNWKRVLYAENGLYQMCIY